MDYGKVFRDILDIVSSNGAVSSSTIRQELEIRGTKISRTTLGKLLAFMCLYDIIECVNVIGRTPIFKIKNPDNLERLIRDCKEKLRWMPIEDNGY